MTESPITIGTTATPIINRVGPRERRWWAARWPKEAAQTLYIGGANVTVNNGIPIYPGEYFDDSNRLFGGAGASDELYGIVGSSETETLRLRTGK